MEILISKGIVHGAYDLLNTRPKWSWLVISRFFFFFFFFFFVFLFFYAFVHFFASLFGLYQLLLFFFGLYQLLLLFIINIYGSKGCEINFVLFLLPLTNYVLFSLLKFPNKFCSSQVLRSHTLNGCHAKEFSLSMTQSRL